MRFARLERTVATSTGASFPLAGLPMVRTKRIPAILLSTSSVTVRAGNDTRAGHPAVAQNLTPPVYLTMSTIRLMAHSEELLQQQLARGPYRSREVVIERALETLPKKDFDPMRRCLDENSDRSCG